MDRCQTKLIARIYSQGCAQNELVMWEIAKVGMMPIDCHALLIMISLSSGVSSFILSMWRQLTVVAIPTIAGELWEYSRKHYKNLTPDEQLTCDLQHPELGNHEERNLHELVGYKMFAF
ncbi:hypothetical protein Y032_0024g1062 [Ancylostoma ceylanicum]|uniref:Uncharacterized protein n=1 Tax=Ancylostoma ceylanicum TaxID=53326 RepID=A0A016UW05_9BILA|nr:hypothetical protein Y032_0024g1062 [Ancylostoma ceylanicum]